LHKERKKTERHLKWAFGQEKDDKEIRRIAREVFANLGQNFVEWVSFPKFKTTNIDSIVETEGLEKFRSVLAQGRGAVLVTAHLGNWELLGATILLKMPDVNGTAVVRRIYYEKFNELIVQMRRSKRFGIVYRDEPPKKMLNCLRRNELLAVLPDQDTQGVDGIFVDFFGRPAYTPKGPAALARAAKTVLGRW